VGLLRPTRGSVYVAGADARPRSIGELARTVGYVFQNPDHQIFAASVAEELAFGPRQLGFGEAAVRERVEEALAFFGLAEHRAEPPAALGYGLRRAVGLAAVLTMRPKVLVLDEPFTGLDWLATERILGWLRALNDAGHTIVLITHNMRAVAELAERALLLSEGRCLAIEPPRCLFADDALLAATGLARPQAAELAHRLRADGVRRLSLDVAELTEDYLGALRRATVSAPPPGPAD
jgi:energy-coupling factor transporter ATP-binding protein EcfA2